MKYVCFIMGVLAMLGRAGAAEVAPAAPKYVVKVDSSGRLVRRIVIPRIAPVKQTPNEPSASTAAIVVPRGGDAIARIVDETARTHNVDPLLVHSVIQVESNYNRFALSPKGAEGLMQLIPATAKRFGVTNSFDPKQNIEAGVKYLRYLKDLFQDDRLALAAYNAGEGAVFKYRSIPPYRETEGYVTKVGKKLGEARVRQKQLAATAQPAEKPREHSPLEQYVDAEGRLYLRTR